jgi:hypothetical protein
VLAARSDGAVTTDSVAARPSAGAVSSSASRRCQWARSDGSMRRSSDRTTAVGREKVPSPRSARGVPRSAARCKPSSTSPVVVSSTRATSSASKLAPTIAAARRNRSTSLGRLETSKIRAVAGAVASWPACSDPRPSSLSHNSRRSRPGPSSGRDAKCRTSGSRSHASWRSTSARACNVALSARSSPSNTIATGAEEASARRLQAATNSASTPCTASSPSTRRRSARAVTSSTVASHVDASSPSNASTRPRASSRGPRVPGRSPGTWIDITSPSEAGSGGTPPTTTACFPAQTRCQMSLMKAPW